MWGISPCCKSYNSFGNKNFMQSMGRLNMHLGGHVFFFLGLGWCGVTFVSFIVAIVHGDATIIGHITRENNYFKPIH
jgi:hypothetical protein